MNGEEIFSIIVGILAIPFIIWFIIFAIKSNINDKKDTKDMEKKIKSLDVLIKNQKKEIEKAKYQKYLENKWLKK